jgi:uncharacterized protein YndB with AHSA1/START domain
MKHKVTGAICFLAFVFGSVYVKADDRSVIATRHMPASPEKVLLAFLDDEDLKSWWQVSRSLVEPSPGGIWSISWDNWGAEKTQHAWSGVIDEVSGQRLVISRMVMNEPDMPLLGPMQLEINVAESEGGSTVTVTHSGYGHGEHWDTIYENVVLGWDHVLGDMEEWFKQEY